MSRELATTEPPPPLAARVVSKIDDMAVVIRHERGRPVIDARHAPDAEQRAWLQGRVAAIDAALSPLGRREAEHQLARLSIVLSPRRYDSEAAAKLAAAEGVAALAPLPRFAVIEAVDDFCLGDAPTTGFAPEAPKVAARAKAKAAPLHAERAKIARILSAEVIAPVQVSPERREQLAAQARELAASMRAEAAKRDVAAGLVSEASLRPPETPEQALDRLASAMRAAPLTAGPGLMATWAKGAG